MRWHNAKQMCGNIFCSFHKQCLPTFPQGAFQLGWLSTEPRAEQHLEAVLKWRVLLSCPVQTEVHLCPGSKVGHCSPVLVTANGMGALSHPKPSAQKRDPGDDILNFHFPFNCHLDLFFLSPTFHINCIQLTGSIRKYYLSLRIDSLSSDIFQYHWFIPFSCIDLLGAFISYIWHKHCIILYCIIP